MNFNTGLRNDTISGVLSSTAGFSDAKSIVRRSGRYIGNGPLPGTIWSTDLEDPRAENFDLFSTKVRRLIDRIDLS